jgi:hypothetical protein
VLVDDKIRILDAVKKVWGGKVTTVFVRQGHYALDSEIIRKFPPADVSIERIGDLVKLGENWWVLEKAGGGSENSTFKRAGRTKGP